MSAVGEAWSAILSEERAEPGWHARRVHQGSPCDIRSAIRQPEAVPALLFEVSSRSIPAGADIPDCIGFKLHPEIIQPGPHGRVRLCLELKDRAYRDVFETLADDVGTTVAAAPGENQGVRVLLGRLHTWERFVSRFGSGLLSDEQQLGLFTELSFLETEVMPAVDAATAIRTWRGPLREPHDFRFRDASVEIKATGSRNPTTFAVSNLDQLDRGGVSLLFVLHLSVDVDAAHGVNLPDLIGRVRLELASVDAAAAADFDSRLIDTGYLQAHADSYRGRTYAIAQRSWYRVDDGFPCLTRVGVPAGITSAEYSVALSACAAYVTGETAARDALKERM